MMPELKMNRPFDVALWRSGEGDGVPHREGCKYLIFRGLSPIFTIFDHISRHFSAVSVWFLAGCRQMMVYLNRRVIASARTCFKRMVFRKRSWNYVPEPEGAASFRRLVKVAQRWKGPQLLPDFQAISGCFRLFQAKLKGRGYLRLALLHRLQPAWSGARLFAARLNRKYYSWITC